jgi:hypothetical protein
MWMLCAGREMSLTWDRAAARWKERLNAFGQDWLVEWT